MNRKVTKNDTEVIAQTIKAKENEIMLLHGVALKQKQLFSILSDFSDFFVELYNAFDAYGAVAGVYKGCRFHLDKCSCPDCNRLACLAVQDIPSFKDRQGNNSKSFDVEGGTIFF
jgi:hypothetical protein